MRGLSLPAPGLYLATVIDPATPMVIGWQLASHLRTSVVTEAREMAFTGGYVRPGAVFPTDCGTSTPRWPSPGSPRPKTSAPAWCARVSFLCCQGASCS